MLVVIAITTVLAAELAEGKTPGNDLIGWAPEAGIGYSRGDWPIVAVWLVALVAGVAALTGVQLRKVAVLLPAVVLLGAVVTLLAYTAVKGDGPDSGGTILAIRPENGVNRGDLPIAALWLVAVLAGSVLMWRSRRTTEVA